MGDRNVEIMGLLHKQSEYLSGKSKEKPSFMGVDMSDMDFSIEDFSGIDLSGADCRRTSFYRCNFCGTDFTGAHLTGARFYKCKMDFTNDEVGIIVPKLLETNKRRAYFHIDTHGSDMVIITGISDYVKFTEPFYGYKVLCIDFCKYAIAKLLIEPDDEVITFENSKCRCASAYVVSIDDGETVYQMGESPIRSNPCNYYVGEYVKADWFDKDWTIECSHGIHFFLTREEAEEYKKYYLRGY